MSKTVLIINRQEKNIIEKFQKGLPLSESEKYILKDIHDFLTEKRENLSKQQFPPDGSPNMMVLMVSQLCNIKCKYCYAHSGTYNTPGIMKEGIGKRALDIASDLGVTNIQFYGGEPLTNFKLISELVEYGDKQGYSFKYGIITNGTLMDKEIGNFLKQHDFEVTISIDGPREINDLNRVYSTGKGTHDDILKAVDLLNELEVPLALEITYARNYIGKYTISEILDYLSDYSKTFIVGYVLPTVDGHRQVYEPTEQEVENMMVELVDYLFTKWEDEIQIREMGICMILRELLDPVYHVKKCICPEFPTRITVFHNGSVYPCHQVYLDKRFYLGHIMDRDFKGTLQSQFKNAVDNFAMSNLYTNNNEQWMFSVCSFCKAHLMEVNGTYYLRYPNAYQKVLEHIIYNMATRNMKSIIRTLGGTIIE